MRENIGHSCGIFVNYRHADSAARASMIHKALKAKLDEDFFLDIDDVSLGDEIAAQVESRLHAAKVLIVVIGPHWLDPAKELGNQRLIDREDDWVRHEIRSALKLGIPIVPTYVDGAEPIKAAWLPADIRALVEGSAKPGSTPTAGPRFVTLRHSDWDADLAAFIELLCTAFGLRRAAARAPTQAPPDAPVGVSRHIIDFGSYIEDKTNRFVGRRFVFDALDQFLKESESGYFVIRGDPGIGKSAVVARIVEGRGYPHHFNIALEGIRSEQRFLSNICAQLIVHHGLPQRSLSFAKDEGVGLLSTLLQEATEQSDEAVVLVVDALDEAEPPSPGSNPLRLPTSLPKGAYVVVSTRRTEQTLELSAERYRVLELEANSDGNLADVGDFIRARAEEKEMGPVLERLGVNCEEFVKRLLLQSEGNFMYLRHVLPAIRSGVLSDLDVAHLPKGLQAYYEHHWNKMRGDDFDRFVNVNQPIIATLATAHRPVSLGFVSKVTGLKMAEVQWTIERWNEFLHKVAAADGARYRVYHASYRDFLATRVAG